MISSLFLSFGSVVVGILAFIFVLGAIILIHEGGHFLFARRYGILCREYAFGMGPQLLKTKKGETEYSIRAFPIGGFCAIAGEEEEDDPLKDNKQVRLIIEEGVVKKICFEVELKLFESIPLYDLVEYDLFDAEETGNLYIKVKEGEVIKTYPVDNQAYYLYAKGYKNQEFDDTAKALKKYSRDYQISPFNRTLDHARKRERIMVMFGGPLSNFILAIVVFIISALISGVPNQKTTVLNEPSSMGPIYEAGIRQGDEIISLKSGSISLETKEWKDISKFMDQYEEKGSYIDIEVTFKDESDNNAIKTENIKPMVIINSISMRNDIKSTDAKIGELNKGSKAYEAGLRTGDIIKKVNNADINNWLDVYSAFKKVTEKKQEVSVEVLRDGKTETFKVIPYSKALFEKTQPVPYVALLLGISPAPTHNIIKCIGNGNVKMYTSVKQMVSTLGLLIGSSEIGVSDLSGPVGIFSMTSKAAQNGFAYLLYWMGFLSVNIGFLNLLPIPALDGGRILFVIIEAIRGKKISKKAETIAINATYYALLALIVFVSYNDIVRLFKGVFK